jgi:hypothetical protein
MRPRLDFCRPENTFPFRYILESIDSVCAYQITVMNIHTMPIPHKLFDWGKKMKFWLLDDLAFGFVTSLPKGRLVWVVG